MDSGGANTSKSNQNGVRGGPLGFSQAVEAEHRGPGQVRILAEVDQVRATGGMVKEILRRRPACSILAKFS
jgi:hypothetical protein